MKEIVIQIPDNKFEFLLELLDQLGVQVGKMSEDDMVIPEFHKEIVMERIKKNTYDPTRMLEWDKVRNNFKFA
jgi:predicted nucleotidyltransferase